MGTTLTLAFASGRRLFVVHAGDSRCYLLHAGKLRQLTEDHTMAAELARRGMIEPEEVGRHQWRHVVTHVLGGCTDEQEPRAACERPVALANEAGGRDNITAVVARFEEA